MTAGDDVNEAKREAVSVSDEYSDPAGESEMRRRAAWLLAMLAVVAVLVVTLMVALLGGNDKHSVSNPISPSSLFPTAPPSSSTSPTAHTSTPTQHRHTAGPATSAKPTRKPKPSRSISTPPRSTHHTVSCPGSQPCIAAGDIGNAVAAINAYREQNGRRAVNGAVTRAAQTCAVTNGGDCHGSWSESQVAAANGQQALHKVLPFAHELLSPSLSSLQVGWAYDPGAKEYYFALIENG